MKLNWVDKIKNAVVGFFFGVRNTEKAVFTQQGGSSDTSTSINEVVSDESLAGSLLRGEVTQEVKSLRYRDYEVSKQSKGFSVLPNGVAYRKDAVSFVNVHVDKSDGYPIQFIQDNTMVVNGVLDELNRVGTYGKTTRYTLNCERKTYPRYRLEELVHKVVVKRIDSDHVMIDFYTTTYMDNLNPIKRNGFISELKKIIEKKLMSDIFDIEKIWLVTSNAYGANDLLRFEYDEIKFDKIIEYDGDYVIKLMCHVLVDGEDLTSKFYDKVMNEKYKANELRSKEYKVKTPDMIEKNMYCADCGKEINVLDGRIVEATVGRPLCVDCLAKLQGN